MMKKALAVLAVGVLVLGVAGSALAHGHVRGYRQGECRYGNDSERGCGYNCRRDDDRGSRDGYWCERHGRREYDGRGANRR